MVLKVNWAPTAIYVYSQANGKTKSNYIASQSQLCIAIIGSTICSFLKLFTSVEGHKIL